MLSKRNRILLGLLGLQMVLVVLFSLPTGPGGGTSKSFFEGVRPEAVTRLTVATADGRSVSVTRQGRGWVVDAAPSYPADQEKIENLLTRLIGLRSDRLVAQTKEAHNRFQVGSRYGQKVVLALPGGERILYLGTSPNYTATHVRVEGDDGVYLVRDLAAWQMPPDEKFWWQREYVSVKPEEVREIALANKAGEFRLFRDGKGWQVSGAAQGLDQAKVEEFVAAASRIALTDYLGQEERPEYGLARPLATLVLTTKAGKVTLAVGAKEEGAGLGGSYVMKSSASPFYARGGSSVLAPIVERRLADLLAAATP